MTIARYYLVLDQMVSFNVFFFFFICLAFILPFFVLRDKRETAAISNKTSVIFFQESLATWPADAGTFQRTIKHHSSLALNSPSFLGRSLPLCPASIPAENWSLFKTTPPLLLHSHPQNNRRKWPLFSASFTRAFTPSPLELDYGVMSSFHFFLLSPLEFWKGNQEKKRMSIYVG